MWFWLGIWIYFYLQFTDYAGIGLAETVLIATFTLAEIPTGVITDFIGKKRSLIIAFTLQTVGGFVMAFTPNFELLMLSIFILCLGGAFYSGTLEALVFDSLKEDGKEKDYAKVISNITSISLFAPAICSVIGGYLYFVDPKLPFILSAFGYLVGLVTSFFLIEPKIDTEKFSIGNFLLQTKSGITQLFATGVVGAQIIFLLSVGFIVVIMNEMLDSFLGVEFGFAEKQMGILWAIIFLVSAISSQFTPTFQKALGAKKAILFVGLVIVTSMIVSPIVGIVLGGATLIIRSSMVGIFNNLTSIAVNNAVESRYRATALSTFNMIKNIPYVLFAYLIGAISNIYTARTISVYLGGILFTFLLIQSFVFIRVRNKVE